MGNFFGENYLLDSESAIAIYEEIKGLPIFDYHSHLSAKEIYEDKPYRDITELWLMADHYKWRLMREAGVEEMYITGDAEPYDKFEAFASILPLFVGNPVYEWAHLELKRYFDINVSICKDNARYIWDKTESIIKERRYSPRKLLSMVGVDTLMTTDDPLDDLAYHGMLKDIGYEVVVEPTFRADKVLGIDKVGFREYITKLSSMTKIEITDIESLTNALTSRLEYFISYGSCLADISIIDIPKCGDQFMANHAFSKAMNGEELTDDEQNSYTYQVLLRLGKMFARYNIVMQLHIGAIRNVNSRRYRALGVDSGIDSVADVLNISRLAVLLDDMDRDNSLPRSIYYTHNDAIYYPLSAMINNFAGDIKGKVQLGAAWWMMDSKEGIRRQLEAFKNTAGLGYFNGMLTDSRSYTSFVRHDYFRRVLSSVLGNMVEEGSLYIQDAKVVASNIAYHNAKQYFK